MTQNMTTGSPWKKILLFTIPILIGSLFQQFYSMADSIIVGKMLGPNALGGVGLTGSITFLVFGLAFGSCSGFAIPVAQDFGAGDFDGVRRCVANIIYACAGITIVITLVTTLLTRQILTLLNTPDDLMGHAYDYLFWIFAGTGAQIMYNMLAGILRSLGDSRTPLIYLVLASILNILLDILFIGPVGMGTAGAAIATVLAQLISGLLCLVHIIKKFPILRLSKADMHPDRIIIRRLMGMGIPMGLQFSITAIGSTVLQSAVNSLGTIVVNSVAVAQKLQILAVAPIEAFGATAATFAGQNYGAGDIRRVRQGVKVNYIMSAICSVAGYLLIWFFSDTMSMMFLSADETEILEKVRYFVCFNGLFYYLLASLLILRNTLQGVGFSKAAMLAGAFEMVGRIAVAWIAVPLWGFTGACLAHPAAWVMANVILIPLYLSLMKKLEKRMQAYV